MRPEKRGPAGRAAAAPRRSRPPRASRRRTAAPVPAAPERRARARRVGVDARAKARRRSRSRNRSASARRRSGATSGSSCISACASRPTSKRSRRSGPAARAWRADARRSQGRGGDSRAAFAQSQAGGAADFGRGSRMSVSAASAPRPSRQTVSSAFHGAGAARTTASRPRRARLYQQSAGPRPRTLEARDDQPLGRARHRDIEQAAMLARRDGLRGEPRVAASARCRSSLPVAQTNTAVAGRGRLELEPFGIVPPARRASRCRAGTRSAPPGPWPRARS